MGLFSFLKNKSSKKTEFLAQVGFIAKETRFKSSIVICTILEGTLNQNDTVFFLDANKKIIAEGKVSVINHNQKSVPHIEKSSTESNDIGLEFYSVSDKPIENTKFICKLIGE